MALLLGTTYLGVKNPPGATFAFLAFTLVLSGISNSAITGIRDLATVCLACVWLGTVMTKYLAGRMFPVPDLSDWAATLFLSILFTQAAVQFYRSPELLRTPELIKSSVLGYGHPLYFLTTTLYWWLGFKLFELVRLHRYTILPLSGLLLWIWCASTVGFFLIQYAWAIPEPLLVGAYKPPATAYAYTSPLDDLSSFGSVTAALFAALLYLPTAGSSRIRVLRWLCGIILVALAALSYSRATWVAVILVMMTHSLMRIGVKWAAICAAAITTIVVAINLWAPFDEWAKNSYLYRVSTLVRFENPTTKLSSRIFMYCKSLNMMQSKPIEGHGLGAFYRKSVDFAAPGDPLAKVPDFAHNAWLQVATEMGVPAALILCVPFAAAIFRRKVQQSNSEPGWLLAALLTYSLTQLTANSLNVYISNQILFWAAVALLSAHSRGESSGLYTNQLVR
jgi:hypothetical protein